jgi:AcrR family transcriptional regulator
MAEVKSTDARSYGGQTGDERAAERRGALLEAAFALVAQDGWRTLRIDALCRRAGLNKRYFYESFTDLDGVAVALTEQVAADAVAATLTAIEPGLDPQQATRAAITALVHYLTDDPRRARVLFGALPATETAAGHRVEAIRGVVAAAATTGRGIHSLPDDPYLDIAAAMLVGGTSQAVLDWIDGEIACSQQELIEDLVSMWWILSADTASHVRGRRGA